MKEEDERIAALASVADAVARHAEVVDSRCLQFAETSRPLVVVKSTGYLAGAELRRHCLESGADAKFDVLLVDELAALSAATITSRLCIMSEVSGTFAPFEEPEGEIEEELVAMWERILNFTPVSVVDDLIDVGGDSMGAMEIAAAIVQRWDVYLSLVDLVGASSVRNLAALVRESQAGR